MVEFNPDISNVQRHFIEINSGKHTFLGPIYAHTVGPVVVSIAKTAEVIKDVLQGLSEIFGRVALGIILLPVNSVRFIFRRELCSNPFSILEGISLIGNAILKGLKIPKIFIVHLVAPELLNTKIKYCEDQRKYVDLQAENDKLKNVNLKLQVEKNTQNHSHANIQSSSDQKDLIIGNLRNELRAKDSEIRKLSEKVVALKALPVPPQPVPPQSVPPQSVPPQLTVPPQPKPIVCRTQGNFLNDLKKPIELKRMEPSTDTETKAVKETNPLILAVTNHNLVDVVRAKFDEEFALNAAEAKVAVLTFLLDKFKDQTKITNNELLAAFHQVVREIEEQDGREYNNANLLDSVLFDDDIKGKEEISLNTFKDRAQKSKEKAEKKLNVKNEAPIDNEKTDTEKKPTYEFINGEYVIANP